MNKRKWLGLVLVWMCLLLGVACSFGSAVTPAVNVPIGQATATGSVAAADDNPDLLLPTTGLSGLTAYQQRLEITLQGQLEGQPYQEKQVLVRTVQGADVALQVEQVVNAQQPVWLFEAQRQGYRYVQQDPTGACRAEVLAEEARSDENLAQRLPAVLAMQFSGKVQHDDAAALRYTFDQQSLSAADGALRSAMGEVLLSEQGGLVLSYQLTAQVQAAGFSGTRTWAYELFLLEDGLPLPMSASCLPVLDDVPILPGAEAVEKQPGFLYYRLKGGNRRAAAEFYAPQLTALGWQALPGAMPDQAYLDGESTALAYRRENVVLVVSLFERDGALLVVVQTVRLQQAEASAGVPDAPLATDEAAIQLPLPKDLPVLADATVLYETEATRVLQTNLPAADVADFYIEQMEQRGWTLSNRFEQGAMITLLWTKADLRLAINIVESNGITTITFASYSS
jgi:hypothetical protein